MFSSSAVLYAQHSNSQCYHRNRGIHFCFCAFIGATTEGKAASEGILFRNTYGKLVKEFICVLQAVFALTEAANPGAACLVCP